MLWRQSALWKPRRWVTKGRLPQSLGASQGLPGRPLAFSVTDGLPVGVWFGGPANPGLGVTQMGGVGHPKAANFLSPSGTMWSEALR